MKILCLMIHTLIQVILNPHCKLVKVFLQHLTQNSITFSYLKKTKFQISVKEQNPGNKNSARTQETFVEAVAPGQTKEFINDVLTENTNEDEFSVPDDIQHALNYKESDALGKMVKLALLDHQKYAKEYIMEVFKCSKYGIGQVREMVP